MAANKDFPGTLIERNGIWHYQVYMPGNKRFKRSTGKANYQAAVAEARKLYQKALLLSGSPDVSPDDLFPKLAKAVVAEVKLLEDHGDHDRAWRVNYCLENFYNWAGNILLESINTDVLARYQVYRSTCKKMVNKKKDGVWVRVPAKGSSPIATSTINLEIGYVRRLLKRYGYDVAKPKPLKKRTGHEGRAFTTEELKKFFDACDAFPRNDPGRYTPLFMLMLCTGTRACELIPGGDAVGEPLLKREIDVKQGIVEVRSGKPQRGKRPKRIRMNVPLYVVEAVASAAKKAPGIYAFPPIDVHTVFSRLLKKAGLSYIDELGEKLTAHSFRHTYGTLQAEAGVEAFVLQNLMRHADPRMTSKYTQRAVRGGLMLDPRRLLGGEKMDDEDDATQAVVV